MYVYDERVDDGTDDGDDGDDNLFLKKECEIASSVSPTELSKGGRGGGGDTRLRGTARSRLL